MNMRSRILTGTAIGLLIAAAPVGSAALAKTPRVAADQERAEGAPVVLAQVTQQDRREEQKKRQEKKAKQQDAEKAAKPQRADKGEAKQQQAKDKADERKAQARKAEARDEKKQKAEQAAGRENEKRDRQGGGAAQRGEAPQAEQPKAKKAEPERAETAPAAEKKQKRAEEKPKRDAEPKQAEQRRDQRAKPERGEAAGARAGDQQQDRDQQQEKAREEKGDASNRQERAEPDRKRDAARKQDQDKRDAGREAERRENGEKAAETPERRGNRQSDAQAQRGEGLPENAAPVLDSQKRPSGDGEGRQRARDDDRRQRDGDAARDGEGPDRDRGDRDRGDRDRRENARDMPLPDSDRAAQRNLKREEFQSLTAEKGKRIDRAAWRDRERRERREGANVLKEFGDRLVLQLNNQTIVQSSDQERLRYRSRDVYYEELPRGRSREVIVRDNGFKVVTIRDEYGDIIRRSRIAPDGQEYVLVYASDRGAHGRGWSDWRDPGRDLPPLELTIPVSEYILESERVRDPDVYYQFLEEPPVEAVEQLYSLDDVKYSARIRDKVRRIDLDTINFEFGSASISESEVDELEAVADAMGRLLDENPAETFLIEGHTDAVGSDVSNLALSDERAASVASTLTDAFGIPPENLVTQGYGEQYLKIETQDRERENRRVAIRRITPLVSPVASAQ